MPLLSSSLSLLPSHPAFVPFSSFLFPERFAPRLRRLCFPDFFFSLSPSVLYRPHLPKYGQIFSSDRHSLSTRRHLTKTFRSRVSFTITHNTLPKRAGMTPFFASVFAISDSDVALHAAAEAGTRSTIIDASGGGPVRGAPRDVAGTDQFGEEQRCRSSGGQRHATGPREADAPCPGAARAGTAFGETSCARGARVRY